MKIDKELYTSHIKDNEKLVKMRRILDKIERVLNYHLTEETDFLDPYERYLAKSILNRFETNYFEYGGLESAERKVFFIFPFYMAENDIKLNLSFLRIDSGLESLSHKDYLGGILNLGIKRDKIGDILVHKRYADIVLKKEISSFLFLNLRKIGNKNVKILEIHSNDISESEETFKEYKKFLSSMRIDVFLSSIYNLTRKESQDMVKSGYVKVNWEQIEKPSKEIDVGDIISTRGYGRAKLVSIDGLSKKGRYNSTIRILT